MKRILLIMVMLISGITMLYAQLPVATLNHEGTMTAFYGFDALRDANEVAVSGDIITLSPGPFNGCIIDNNILVRGVGIDPDTAANIAVTKITTPLHCTAAAVEGEAVKFEGLVIEDMNSVYMGSQSHVVFNKCDIHIQEYDCWTDAKIINCRVKVSSSLARTTTFYNSYVYFSTVWGSGLGSAPTGCTFYSCVIDGGYETNEPYTALNSIILNSDIPEVFTLYNCVGIKKSNGDNVFGITGTSGCVNKTYAEVFTTYRGTEATNNNRYEVTDAFATGFLGTDGTQVGLYGGLYPYDILIYPRILRFEVSQRPDENGDLSVEVEVANE